MLRRTRLLAWLILGFTGYASSGWADYPRPWQMFFQEPASKIAEAIIDIHQIIFMIIIGVIAVVLVGLTYICIRFSAARHPVSSRCAHNTWLEIVWTLIPCVLLVIIAVPTLRTLYYMEYHENQHDSINMTIKVIGHQWYWQYQYPDHDGISFDSYLVPEKDLKPGQMRLLAVDQPVVVPAQTNIRLLFTSADVIHSWGVPSLGIKRDCVPGRTNDAWVRIEKPGIYYGHCYELCGDGHGFMPIVVEALPPDEFAQWALHAKQQFS